MSADSKFSSLMAVSHRRRVSSFFLATMCSTTSCHGAVRLLSDDGFHDELPYAGGCCGVADHQMCPCHLDMETGEVVGLVFQIQQPMGHLTRHAHAAHSVIEEIVEGFGVLAGIATHRVPVYYRGRDGKLDCNPVAREENLQNTMLVLRQKPNRKCQTH
jgi:hypothetical protein